MSYDSYKEAYTVWVRAQREYNKLIPQFNAALTIRDQAWANLEREAASLSSEDSARVSKEQFGK